LSFFKTTAGNLQNLPAVVSFVSCSLHGRRSTSPAFPRPFLVLFGAAGAGFGSGSPAFSGRFLFFFFNFAGLLLLLGPGLRSAAGAALSPSPAGRSGFFHLSTAGARLSPSPASGMGTGRRDAAHAQQPGDSQAGKKFFQLLGVHDSLLSAGRRGLIHSIKKGNSIESINIFISVLVKQSFFQGVSDQIYLTENN